MRAVDGSGELTVPAYDLFSGTEIRGRMAMERMLTGLSTRRYPLGLERVGARTAQSVTATFNSAVSRRFVAQTETALAELLAARRVRPPGNPEMPTPQDQKRSRSVAGVATFHRRNQDAYADRSPGTDTPNLFNAGPGRSRPAAGISQALIGVTRVTPVALRGPTPSEDRLSPELGRQHHLCATGWQGVHR